MSKKSVKKLMEKQAYQARVNPNPNKKAYVQPLRPRSVVITPKTVYDRKNTRREIARACEW